MEIIEQVGMCERRVQLFTDCSVYEIVGLGIMNIWQMLGTLVEAIVLMEVILGKDVATPDGAILGTAADIELDLTRDKIWVMVQNQGWRRRIPSEQIANLTDSVILFNSWTTAYLEREVVTLV